MSKYEVVDAKVEHIEPIARNIRQADLNEIFATAGILARPALLYSLATAVHSGTYLIDGAPAAMGGVNADGVIWLITTELIDAHHKEFLKESRRQLEYAKQFFDCLYNVVDARNERAIRWLRWLNFTFEGPFPFGVFRKPFYRFYWMRDAGTCMAVDSDSVGCE